MNVDQERCEANLIWQRPTRCVVTNLYNIFYTVCTQQYISTVILYIQSGHITATCFDRKRSSSGQYRTFIVPQKCSLLAWRWPFRSKHVTVMWPDCIYNITALIYCCVLTVYNTLYKFVTAQLDDLYQIEMIRSSTPIKLPLRLLYFLWFCNGYD